MSAKYYALNRYKYMWIYVMFDLPTTTKKQRKDAADFRKTLVKDGFSMLQYSVYIRHCASYSNNEVHILVLLSAENLKFRRQLPHNWNFFEILERSN